MERQKAKWIRLKKKYREGKDEKIHRKQKK